MVTAFEYGMDNSASAGMKGSGWLVWDNLLAVALGYTFVIPLDLPRNNTRCAPIAERMTDIQYATAGLNSSVAMILVC